MSSSVFLCTCRGVYLASLVYSEDSKVLVTVDDQVPIVEVSDSHSSAIGADFVWLAKVSGEEKGEGGGRRRRERRRERRRGRRRERRERRRERRKRRRERRREKGRKEGSE